MRLYRSRVQAVMLAIAGALAIMLNLSCQSQEHFGHVGATLRKTDSVITPPPRPNDEEFVVAFCEDANQMLEEGDSLQDVRKMIKEKVLSRPDLERAWVISAWLFAYNFRAKEENSELRWECLDEAICWLRDEGLKYNPTSSKIMKEIAWIYFHKFVQDADAHNAYYKHRWALLMHSLLGPPEMQDIPGIVAAPKELSLLLADQDVAKALANFDITTPEQNIAAVGTAEGLHQIPRPVHNALLAPENAEAWRKVRCFVARRVLTDVYKFDNPNDPPDTIGIMLDMERTYGKFDWRLPEPHAIFWASLALNAIAPNKSEEYGQAQKDYNRIMFLSLQKSIDRGRIVYLSGNPEEPIITSSELSRIKLLNDLYHEMLMEYGIDERGERSESIYSGHILFLQESTFDLYFSGYQNEALKYYKELNERYGKPTPRIPLKNYCMGRVEDFVVFGREQKIRALANGCIAKMLFYYCTNNMDDARKWETVGRRVWETYRSDEESFDNQGIIRHRVLPEWEDFLADRIYRILWSEDKDFPSDLLPVLSTSLGIKDLEELDLLDFGKDIVPAIPPSSSP